METAKAGKPVETKLFDLLGNPVLEGSVLYWKSVGAVVMVKGIAIEENEAKGKPVGRIRLEIVVPVEIPGPQVYLNDFLRVVNPAEQEALTKLMSGKGVAVA